MRKEWLKSSRPSDFPSTNEKLERDESIADEDNGRTLPFGDTTKKLAQVWRECNVDTREKFEAEAKKEQEGSVA